MECDTCDGITIIERDHREYMACHLAAFNYKIPYHFVLIAKKKPMWCPNNEYNDRIDEWVQAVKEFL